MSGHQHMHHKKSGGGELAAERSNENTELSTASASNAESESSSLMNWISGGTNWLGDRYNDAVSGITNTLSRVRDGAKELMDVVRETDIDADFFAGKYSISTDLDELEDLIDFEMLDFDREASDNQVQIDIDTNLGEVTVSLPSVAVHSINSNGLQMGPSQLKNVQISIQNGSFDVPLLGEISIRDQISSDSNIKGNTKVHVSIGQAIGSNVVYVDPDNGQETSVNKVTLNQLSIDASLKDGFGEPLTTADFSVASANIDGLDASGFAGSVDINAANGSYNSAQNTAALNAQRVVGNGIALDSHSTSIEQSSIDGLSANITGIDNTDQAAVNISARAVMANNVDSSVGGLSAANAAGVNGTFQLSGAESSVTADSINAAGVSGSTFAVDDASVAGFTANKSGDSITANLNSGSLSGYESASTNLDSASLSNLSLNRSQNQQHLALGSANINGLSHNNLQVGSASVQQLSAGADVDPKKPSSTNFGVSVGALDATGIQSGVGSGRQVSAGGVSASNLSLEHSSGPKSQSIQLSGDQLSVARLHGQSNHGSASASELNMGNFSADVQATNGSPHLTSSIGSMSLSEAVLSPSGQSAVHVQHAEANNIAADLDASSLDGHIAAQKLAVEGVHNDQLSFGSASLHNLQTSQSTQNNGDIHFSAGVDHVFASDSQAKGIGNVDEVEASGFGVQITPHEAAASLDRFKATGLSDDIIGSSTEQLSANNATFKSNSGTIEAALGDAEAIGFKNHDERGHTLMSVEQANLQGASGIINPTIGHAETSLSRASFENAQFAAPGGASIAIADGSLENGQFSGNKDSQNISVGSIAANSIAMNDQRSGANAHMQQANVDQLAITNSTSSGVSANASSISAGGIGFNSGKSSSGSGSNESSQSASNIQSSRLLETGLKRVDSANISASVALNEGSYGSGIKSFNVEPNTVLNSDVNIRNNQIQDGSHATLNNRLDAFAWIGVDGAYVKDGDVKADLSGFRDRNLSSTINNSMGLGGEHLHSLGDYGQAMSSENNQASSSEQGSGSGYDGIIDTSSLAVSGDVALSDGLVDFGAGSFNLSGSETAGANQAQFSSNSNELSMAVAKFFATSLSLNTSAGSANADSAALVDVGVDVNNSTGETNGQIGGVRIDNVSLNQ